MKKLYFLFIIWTFSISAHANDINLTPESIKGEWEIISLKIPQMSETIPSDGTEFWVFTNNKHTFIKSGREMYTFDYSIKGDQIVVTDYAGDNSIMKVNSILKNKLQLVVDGNTFNLVRVVK